MNPDLREYFDRHLEAVLAELPQRVHDLISEVPLHVEDHPPPEVLEELGVRRRSDLCGLYTGVSLDRRSTFDSARLPDVITIYREGILSLSTRFDGRLDEGELKHQIRVTVLHELGHHHGLDEDELHELGYG